MDAMRRRMMRRRSRAGRSILTKTRMRKYAPRSVRRLDAVARVAFSMLDAR